MPGKIVAAFLEKNLKTHTADQLWLHLVQQGHPPREVDEALGGVIQGRFQRHQARRKRASAVLKLQAVLLVTMWAGLLGYLYSHIR